jgi:hypothetical protein
MGAEDFIQDFFSRTNYTLRHAQQFLLVQESPPWSLLKEMKLEHSVQQCEQSLKYQ